MKVRTFLQESKFKNLWICNGKKNTLVDEKLEDIPVGSEIKPEKQQEKPLEVGIKFL